MFNYHVSQEAELPIAQGLRCVEFVYIKITYHRCFVGGSQSQTRDRKREAPGVAGFRNPSLSVTPCISPHAGSTAIACRSLPIRLMHDDAIASTGH